MNLGHIKPGSRVFIDANIFIYHFTDRSEESSNFLSRCEKGEVYGFTSTNVLLEVLHHLMMIEAVSRGLVKPPNVLRKLEKDPAKVRLLSEYFIYTLKIPDMGIDVMPISFDAIVKSQPVRASYGLLVNDSLAVAMMQEKAVRDLASGDKTFSRVKGLSVYSPADLVP
jgi:predicted nucleic acid-binding protein